MKIGLEVFFHRPYFFLSKIKNRYGRRIVAFWTLFSFLGVQSFITPILALAFFGIGVPQKTSADNFQEKEVEELRTETAKVFQVGQNEFRYEESADRIHYKENGKWKDVDSSIVKKKDGKYAYQNKANDFTFSAAENLSDGVKFEGFGQSCSFKLADITEPESKEKGTSPEAPVRRNGGNSPLAEKDKEQRTEGQLTMEKEKSDGEVENILKREDNFLEEEKIVDQLTSESADLFPSIEKKDEKNEESLKQIKGVSDKKNIKNSKVKINKNKITYPDIQDNVDLEFTVLPAGLSTEVVVKKKTQLDEIQDIVFEIGDDCDPKDFQEPTMTDAKDGAKVESEIEKKDGKRYWILKPDFSQLGEIDGEVRIDPTAIKSPNINVFTSQYGANGHARRFLAVGKFYDTTVPAYYGESETYLQFDVSLPTNAVVTGAELSMRRYANGGAGFNSQLSRLTQSISSSTGASTNDWKSYTGNYDTIYIDSGDWDFRDYRWNATTMVNQWRSGTPNYGMAVVGPGAAYQSGAAFCSSRSDGFCLWEHRPILYINYYINNPPWTPNPVAPSNNATFSGNCDESQTPPTGICRTQTNVPFTINNVGDGDGNLDYTRFYFSGANTFQSSNRYGSGTLNYSANFNDGLTQWQARSVDTYGLWGDYSSQFQFITDTTPPEIPNPQSLPEYTAGVGIESTIQVEPSTDPTTDNVSTPSNIWYEVQYSKFSDFSSDVFVKPYQEGDPTFEIGPKGADGIEETSDDLTEDGVYYFRFKAKDALNNISNYSSVISTTLDGTHPVVMSFSRDLERFSPNNATSVGITDEVNFSYQVTEKYPDRAQLIIKDSIGTVVRTIEEDLLSLSDITNHTVNFIWDGTDDGGNFLSDGAYTVENLVLDKAGNESEDLTTFIVVVDNHGANITISSPQNEYWTNQTTVDITGQVKSPHVLGNEDQDLETFEIRKITDVFLSVLYDVNFIYTNTQDLDLGLNQFELKTIDTVGNEIVENLTVYRENTQPVIHTVTPHSLTNDIQPEIIFHVDDPDPSGDFSQTSGIPIGTNPKDMKVWMTYPYLDGNGDWQTATKELIEDSVNLDPILVGNLSCAENGTPIHSKNGLTVSQNVTCSLPFVSDLQPDTTYTIHLDVKDIAGNQTVKEDVSFQLDTHNYLLADNPIEGAIYSNSSVWMQGKIAKDSELRIQNTQLGEDESFIVNESLDGVGYDAVFIQSDFEVSCGEFLDIDGRSDTPDEEICSWKVKVEQSYATTDTDTANTNILTATDAAGNIVEETRNITVNLYSFDLAITSDINYFSPNGDGNQDGLKFTHTAENPTDPVNPPEISEYEVRIIDSSDQVVWIGSGSSILPLNTFFDGQVNGGWLSDGDYEFELLVKTNDDAEKLTGRQQVFARTSLADEVYITNPKDGHITTNGVITVQGQAPPEQAADGSLSPMRGSVWIEICVDMLTTPNSIACDLTETVKADEYGFFSTLLVLPRIEGQTHTQHRISAKAYDDYGNQTVRSNIVGVTLDTVDPFAYVTAMPALTGVTSEEDYEKFLNGEIDINSIRSVILTSGVTQNTEQVELSLADYTNLSQRPDSPQFGLIGTLTDEQELDARFNPNADTDIKKLYEKPLGDILLPANNCSESTGCEWKYQLPMTQGYAGVYEINFKGKKGETIQEMTAGFKADGTIPAQPLIMLVEKWDDDSSNYLKISKIHEKYYTNQKAIRLRGAAEPNTEIIITSNSVELVTVQSSIAGIWEAEITLDGQGAINPNEYLFIAIAREYDGGGSLINEVYSANEVNVIYDTTPPSVVDIERDTPKDTITGWLRTGDEATFTIESNEGLKYADLIKEDDFVRILTNISEEKKWQGTINVDREEEGYYKPKVRIQDYAGNLSEYLSENWETDRLEDWRIYIDNTDPDETEIDTNNWGDGKDGIYADKEDPELGRLNPEYVISRDRVEVFGKAEFGQRVEFEVNNDLEETIEITDDDCKDTNIDDKKDDTQIIDDDGNIAAKDGLVVRYDKICTWEYEYKFLGKGKNNSYGFPQDDYVLQVRTLDKAGNRSDWTKQEILYDDRQNPYKIWFDEPSDVIDWPHRPITKHLSTKIFTYAEQRADMQMWSTDPKGNEHEYHFFRNPDNGKITTTLKLGAKSDERSGCTQMSGKRRIGTCEDGKYNFSMRATDAAGNQSDYSKFWIERDTVKPAKPKVILSKSGGIGNEVMHVTIDGEPESVALISINASYRSNGYHRRLDSSGKYSMNYSMVCGEVPHVVSVRLVDRAENKSDLTVASIMSDECPRCSYEGGEIAHPIHNPKATVTSGYMTPQRPNHMGIDFAIAGGPDASWREPIYPAAYGDVIAVRQQGGSRFDQMNKVNIKSENLETRYYHLDNEAQNVVGYEQVDTNRVIGHMGNTGECRSKYSGPHAGTHLHFETLINGHHVNPAGYLGEGANVVCEAEGSGDEDSSDYSPIGEKEAKDAIAKFIDEKLITEAGLTEIENAVHQWCGVWVQDLDQITEKNGEYGYDGIIIYNPYDHYPVLVKSGIWDKYRDKGGPCGILGVPKRTRGHYTEQGAGIQKKSKPDDAAYQNFRKAEYNDNQIYWYRWGKNNNATYMVINEVANVYEGTWSDKGFPIQDTSFTCDSCRAGAKQEFEFGRINRCHNLTDVIHSVDLKIASTQLVSGIPRINDGLKMPWLRIEAIPLDQNGKKIHGCFDDCDFDWKLVVDYYDDKNAYIGYNNIENLIVNQGTVKHIISVDNRQWKGRSAGHGFEINKRTDKNVWYVNWENNFGGGFVALRVKIEGRSLPGNFSEFKILGSNPTWQKVWEHLSGNNTYNDNHDCQSLAAYNEESVVASEPATTIKQFHYLSCYEQHQGWPLLNAIGVCRKGDTSDGGIGVSQLTNPRASYREAWDWKVNSVKGELILSGKKTAAKNYLDSHSYSNKQFLLEAYHRYRGGSYHAWDKSKGWVKNTTRSDADDKFDTYKELSCYNEDFPKN